MGASVIFIADSFLSMLSILCPIHRWRINNIDKKIKFGEMCASSVKWNLIGTASFDEDNNVGFIMNSGEFVAEADFFKLSDISW